MARPVTVDPPLYQPGNGEGKSHRQPDIAEIKGRRMKGQSRVLQDRVQAASVERCAVEAGERVRGEQAEGKEAGCHHGLHCQCADLQRRIHPAPAGREYCGEQRQNHDPQQKRSLMVPPCPGNLVNERLCRMGMAGDKSYREIRNNEGVEEGGEGDEHCARHDKGRRGRQRAEDSDPPAQADERQH